MSSILTCWRVGTEPRFVPGCTTEKCTSCGAEVTVAPSSRELMKLKGPMVIVCTICVTTKEEFKDAQWMGWGNEVVKEIRKEMN